MSIADQGSWINTGPRNLLWHPDTSRC
jgi:hypothetical protein